MMTLQIDRSTDTFEPAVPLANPLRALIENSPLTRREIIERVGGVTKVQFYNIIHGHNRRVSREDVDRIVLAAGGEPSQRFYEQFMAWREHHTNRVGAAGRRTRSAACARQMYDDGEDEDLWRGAGQ